MTTIPIEKLDPDAVVPRKANPADAGFDLHTMEGAVLEPGERDLFRTGIAVAIPEGYVGIIKPRSGLAMRHGIDVLAGVVDAGYRGEVGVVLHNTDPKEAYVVNVKERIAQLVVVPVPEFEFEEVPRLPDSVRGEDGFGSTGRH